MIVALRPWQDLTSIPPLGPKARAASLALGAVLLWATWPTLATWAQPAPPFLILALGSATGFVVSVMCATATGQGRAWMRTPPRTLLLVAGGLLTNNVLYLMAMPRIGPAEANVISYLWPILLVLIASHMDRLRLTRGQWLGMGAAFAGAALALGPTFAQGFDAGGVLLAFSSGLTFAVYAAVRSHGQCALSVELAWGELRHEAGMAITDANYLRVNAGEEAARAEAEAFTEEDGVWRGKVANSCLGDMEGERIACETELQRDRAVLYYARLAKMAGSP